MRQRHCPDPEVTKSFPPWLVETERRILQLPMHPAQLEAALVLVENLEFEFSIPDVEISPILHPVSGVQKICACLAWGRVETALAHLFPVFFEEGVLQVHCALWAGCAQLCEYWMKRPTSEARHVILWTLGRDRA